VIYVLHGENVSAIRNFILKLKKDHNIGSSKELLLEDTSPAEIAELISGIDMFGAIPMVTLDVTKMGRTKVDSYIEVLLSVPDESLFVVFSGKDLYKANAFVKQSPKIGARVMPFKEISDSNIFKLVDYVFGGNRIASYKELRKLILSGADNFYIFSMLVYGLRNVTYAKFESPMFTKMSPFVKSKASSQSQKFTQDQVVRLYEKFYQLDVGSKNGQVSPELLVPLGIEAVLAEL